jgi:hypothetical protein
MIWNDYLRMSVLLFTAAWVASSVLGQGGLLAVLLSLWILGRLWLVRNSQEIPPILRRPITRAKSKRLRQ